MKPVPVALVADADILNRARRIHAEQMDSFRRASKRRQVELGDEVMLLLLRHGTFPTDHSIGQCLDSHATNWRPQVELQERTTTVRLANDDSETDPWKAVSARRYSKDAMWGGRMTSHLGRETGNAINAAGRGSQQSRRLVSQRPPDPRRARGRGCRSLSQGTDRPRISGTTGPSAPPARAQAREL